MIKYIESICLVCILLWNTAEVTYIDFDDHSTSIYAHPCERECDDEPAPRICYYQFTVEWYYTMSKACYGCPFNKTDCSRPDCIAANGVEKAIIIVNRQLPGPSIQVCENDTIIVDVINQVGSETVSIHWHGMHQVRTPYMDGVPMVTQCPITPSTVFRYQFLASPAGTHFWHSHSGLQRADGVHGILVVRQPSSSDPHFNMYDYDLPEHALLVTDWLSELSFDRFVAHHHDSGTNKPQSVLVNGKGRFRKFEDEYGNITYTPVEVVRVEQGKSYRIRIASNGILNCPLRISIDKHHILIIATDGQPIEPMEVDSIVVYAGERFDFVIKANQKIGSYWIKLQGLLDCDERFTKASQVAILRYRGAPEEDPEGDNTYFAMSRIGKQLNPLNMGTQGDNISVVDLNALAADDRSLKETPTIKFYLPFDFNEVNNKHFHHPRYYPIKGMEKKHKLYTPQFNDISMIMPSSPLLSQPEATPSWKLCNHLTNKKNCTQEYCECVYTLNIPLGAVVELILIDKGFTFDANHPIHIHGLNFRVIAMERVGQNVTLEHIMELERLGKIKRKLKGAVIKDTVTVPDGGYTIIRFVATNPGYWMLHCHIEFHIEIGMGLIFKVGEKSNMQPVPLNFPQCGNWPTADSFEDNSKSSNKTVHSLANIHFVKETHLLTILFFTMILMLT